MKDTEYAFAVSAIRVRENGLLKQSDFESLITAPDENSALRMLEDRGFSGITEDTEGVLSSKLSDVTDFIMDVSPDKDLLTFLFIKNDFHNLKAIMKCAMTGEDPDRFLLPAVTVSTDELKKAVSEKSFGSLPEAMAKPAEDAWNAIVSRMNGQLCEMILDRAAIEQSVATAEASGDRFSIGLARLRRNLSALLIAYRCAMAGKSRDFVVMALPATDSPSTDALVKAASEGCGSVIAAARSAGIPLDDNAEGSDIIRVTRESEDNYIAGSAFVSMGTAPVIAYYLRCDREIARIRMILSCKRSGLSDELIRRRIGL